MRKPHTHHCADCEQDVACPGTFDPAYEWPSAVCDYYDGGRVTFLCDDCLEARQQAIRDEARADNDR